MTYTSLIWNNTFKHLFNANVNGKFGSTAASLINDFVIFYICNERQVMAYVSSNNKYNLCLTSPSIDTPFPRTFLPMLKNRTPVTSIFNEESENRYQTTVSKINTTESDFTIKNQYLNLKWDEHSNNTFKVKSLKSRNKHRANYLIARHCWEILFVLECPLGIEKNLDSPQVTRS